MQFTINYDILNEQVSRILHYEAYIDVLFVVIIKQPCYSCIQPHNGFKKLPRIIVNKQNLIFTLILFFVNKKGA